MENTYFLAHHGILGMKWGVRRYQNKDGTLTELGKKRGRELASKLRDSDSNGSDTKTFSKIVQKDKAIRAFNKQSQEYKDYKMALAVAKDKYLKLQRKTDNANFDANYRAQRELGYTMSEAINSGDREKITRFFETGKKYFDENYKKRKLNELEEESEFSIDVARSYAKKYEAAGREFLSKYLGEAGNEKSKNVLALKVDLDTQEVSQQNLLDRVSSEMLRNASGIPK